LTTDLPPPSGQGAPAPTDKHIVYFLWSIPNLRKPSITGPSSRQIFFQEKALISFDFVFRIELFQPVIVTPSQKSFSSPSRPLALRHLNQPSMSSGFRKKNSGRSGGERFFMTQALPKAIPSRRFML
jgi:hypothetical protein